MFLGATPARTASSRNAEALASASAATRNDTGRPFAGTSMRASKQSLHWAQPAIRRYCAFPARSHVVTPSCPISNATGRRRSPPQAEAASAAVTVKAATHALNGPA